MAKYFRPIVGNSDEKEIMYDSGIKVRIVNRKENIKPRNENVSRCSLNTPVNECSVSVLQTNNILRSKVSNYKKYISYVSSPKVSPANDMLVGNKVYKNKQTKSSNTGTSLQKENKNFTLKKAGKNIRQYMIVSFKRIKKEPEKISQTKKTRDPRISQFEDGGSERKTYTSNRRYSKSIIKYQTLPKIEEGEEPNSEARFNSSNISNSYEGRRCSQCQIELEATLNKIKRTKEKMILSAHKEGMTSAGAYRGGKVLSTEIYYQPQRILQINVM